MRLEDYMVDINTRSLDSMHKFVYAMISHTADLFNFRYSSSSKTDFHLMSLVANNHSKNIFFQVYTLRR